MFSVSDLVEAYKTHARGYYRKPKSRRLTPEYGLIERAMDGLLAVAGDLDADEVDAPTIAAARRWILGNTDNARKTVNGKVARMVRMFAWAADPEQSLVSALTLAKVRSVRPLQYGRSSARETEGVRSVERSAVTDLLAGLFEPPADGRAQSRRTLVARRKLATMIELQLETGMRPGEVCSMRREELVRDAASDAWLYTPAEHKTEHHGRERRILIAGARHGSSAAGILERWLEQQGITAGPVFAMTRDAYCRTVQRHLKRLGLPKWSPHQLRHTMATLTADTLGLQVAQVLLGHASIKTTEGYVDQDVQLQAVMKRMQR